MADWIQIDKNKTHSNREKEKAKKLRQSTWWKNKIASGVCHYCRKEVGGKELTMDHVVPLVRGGKSSKGNIVASCKPCNNKKKYLTPAEIILEELKEESLTG